MTQVDFYVLPDSTPRGRTLFACKLAEKAFSLGHRSFVHLTSETEARELDNLMWTFRDRSFLPHCLAGEDAQAPVHLGFGQEPAEEFHLLINLSPEIPGFFSRFERVAEVLDASDETRAQGRQRYRFYKDRGYPLETHKL
ncbi:MAG: DNA polymerase III subunit chi [Gammaproteobacteria bacterium]|nr:DNA polymerase III subunit chi [Gammaproteobacteria bacterium]